MFCTTSVLGISCQHINHPNLFVRRVYQFRVYIIVRIILLHLGIHLPQGGSSNVKNSYIKNACYR